MVIGAFSTLADRIRGRRKHLLAIVIISATLWAALYPRQFMALWATPDQQGQILFTLGYYAEAAQRFENPLWQAISHYGAEQFEAAATVFSQYRDENGLLAQANAWAHSRNYLQAMQWYQQLQRQYPGSEAAATNIPIVQALIDANQRLSESQASEPGDLASSADDQGPQSSQGDEREVFELTPEQQLTAEQLLQDPRLNELWMRQVQKDPSQFLQIKFYMQLEERERRSGLPSAVNDGESPP